MSHNLSTDEAKALLQDRVKFKLYAADNHLDNLRSFKQSDNIKIHTEEGRVPWEIEIECCLFHLIGVRDSLLTQINDKLQLKLEKRQIRPRNVKMILNAIGKESLLTNLNKFELGRFSTINKLRNQSTHTSLINVHYKVEAGSSDEPEVYFAIDQEAELEVIPFLEQSLKDMKDLVENIKNVEPLLM